MGKHDNNGLQQKEAPMVLDLSNFVKEVDRFSRLIEPFALLFYTIDDIRRWRFLKGTIALWLISNLACIILTQGAVFVLASAVVIGVATISLFQVHTQILTKLLPSNKPPFSFEPQEEEHGTLDTVQHFRYSLISVHDFVVKSNEYLNYFYSILRWDSLGPSALYHFEACVFVLSLVVGPARWNCFLFINWFFLCHPHILKRGYTYLKDQAGQTKPTSSENSGAQETVTKEIKSSENDEKDKDNCEVEDCEGMDDEDSDLDLTDEVGDKSMISLDPSPNKPGMVARFMEIKKRRKQIASAPAAMKETVVVCCSCHELLNSQGTATSREVLTESHDSG